MVRRKLVKEGRVAYWVDGRLPPKPTLISRTTIHKMVHNGVDRETIINSHLYKGSYRCKLDRYENFIQIMDLFLQSHEAASEKLKDYFVGLLDPFTELAEKSYLVQELTEAKMYHKNKNNFRVLLLLSNTEYPAIIEQDVEKLVSIAPFIISSAESFRDYTCFQERLDRFLFDTMELISEPSNIKAYLQNTGFGTEHLVYRKSWQ